MDDDDNKLCNTERSTFVKLPAHIIAIESQSNLSLYRGELEKRVDVKKRLICKNLDPGH